MHLPINATSISISGTAFQGCSSLTELTIPAGVTTISMYAFGGCSSMTKLTFAEGFKGSIGNGAFQGCSALTDLTIPEGVTSIAEAAFSDCKKLNSLSIPSTLKTIPKGAFSNCSSLTKVVIPEGVTTISDDAFRNCTSLESFSIPASLTSFGTLVFGEDRKIGDITVSSESTHFVVYNGCLYELTNGVKTRLIVCLTSTTGTIEIPEGVTSVDTQAFSLVSGVTSVVVPESVTTIGAAAFNSIVNPGVTSLVMNTSTPPTISGNGIINTGKAKIKVPYDAIDAYKSEWGTNYTYVATPVFKVADEGKMVSSTYNEASATATITFSVTNGFAYKEVTVSDGTTTSTASATLSGNTVTISNVEVATYTVTFTTKATFASADADKGTVSATYTAADAATVAISPATGYQLVSATKNGNDYAVTKGATSVSVTGIATGDAYVFTFDDVAKSASFEAGANGSISVEYSGTTATVTLTPDAGYEYAGATNKGSEVSLSPTDGVITISGVTSTDAYVFNFTDIARGAKFTEPENGTIDVTYSGAKAYVTVTPNSGYVFKTVTKDGVETELAPNDEGVITISGVTKNDVYAFTFEDIAKSATFDTDGNGEITGDITYGGATVTFTITPADGFEYDAVTSDATTFEASLSGNILTITGVEAGAAYTVTFKAIKKPTKIESIESKAEVIAIFDLTGKNVSQMSRGVYFVKYSDGSVEKVVKK